MLKKLQLELHVFFDFGEVLRVFDRGNRVIHLVTEYLDLFVGHHLFELDLDARRDHDIWRDTD